MEVSEIRHLGILDWRTEKVRDVKNWRTRPKPYIEYPEKGLLSSSEKHFFYEAGLRMGAEKHFVNLGTWGGSSIACFAYGLRDAKTRSIIHAVDIFSIDKVRCMPEKIPQHFKNLGLDVFADLHICKGFTADWASEFEETPIKFLFIDANHSYKNCKEDFVLYSPMVEIGGEVMFHDCEYDGVDKTINEALATPEWELVEQIWRLKIIRRIK